MCFAGPQVESQKQQTPEPGVNCRPFAQHNETPHMWPRNEKYPVVRETIN